jgi:ferredoxin, 2Fe-2S
LHPEENKEMYTIKFNFEQTGVAPIEFFDIQPGQSILEVALNNDIELHYNCGGVCACSTCQVYIDKGDCHLERISEREEDFIDMAENPKSTSRLSCQCLLNDEKGEVEVTIPDQRLIDE